ncbi:MAG: DUF4864 domain-containing protein [Opitutae bacterium]|nr:DUF4864 domain-containing protein [Opitutae bacterium]
MRGWVVAFLGIWLATATAGAPERAESWRLSPAETRDAVRATVAAQLQALRAGKFDAAYALAASGIRRQFTAPGFAAMLRRGYPALLEHRRFEAGLVRGDRERHAQVTFTVYDAADTAKDYRYTLVNEDGRWLIEGVVAGRAEPSRGI